MPRRCRGIRGDVGIAPYETATEKPCVRVGFCHARKWQSLRQRGAL